MVTFSVSNRKPIVLIHTKQCMVFQELLLGRKQNLLVLLLPALVLLEPYRKPQPLCYSQTVQISCRLPCKIFIFIAG